MVENEQYSKATRETAENLRIIDDAMFRLVAERKEVCQEILRTLLDRPQLTVVSVTPQCVITSLHREIILDQPHLTKIHNRLHMASTFSFYLPR